MTSLPQTKGRSRTLILWVILCLSLLSFVHCSDDNRTLRNTVLPDSGVSEQDDADEPDSDLIVPDGDILCGQTELRISRVTPPLLIVLDRSNSMLDNGHWQYVREAIARITDRYEGKIAFGLMVFPRSDGSSACSYSINECEPPTRPIVRCAPRNGRDIEIKLENLDTCGGTPVAESLEAASDYFWNFVDPTYVQPQVVQNSVLLATDGAPNCNDALDGGSCRCTSLVGGCEAFPLNCLDDERTLRAVDTLRQVGSNVYVLGILASQWQGILSEIASRGGTDRAFMAENYEAIYDILDEMTEGLTSCEVHLHDSHLITDPELVNFYVDDQLVHEDETCNSGWTWTDENYNRILFCGSSCDLLKEGFNIEIRATFGCPDVI